MSRVSVDAGAFRMVLNMLTRAAERHGERTLADAANEIRATAEVIAPTPPASQESVGDFIDAAAEGIPADVLLTARAEQAEEELRHADQTITTLTAELAEARRQRDRLAQENLERAEAVIAQAANARSLADALKKLNNAARISGGVAGADKNLMDACENAERALSLTGTGRAVNAVLDVLEQLRVTDARLHEVAALCAATEQQRDSLRDECERLREAVSHYEAAIKAECPHGAKSATFEHWSAARKAALSASGREE